MARKSRPARKALAKKSSRRKVTRPLAAKRAGGAPRFFRDVRSNGRGMGAGVGRQSVDTEGLSAGPTERQNR